MPSAPKPRPQSKCVVREPYLSRSLQRPCTKYRSTPLSNNPVQRRHAPGNGRALVRHGNGRLRRSRANSIHSLPENSRCALSPVLLRARVCNPPGVVNAFAWAHRDVHRTGSTCTVGDMPTDRIVPESGWSLRLDRCVLENVLY